MKTALLLAAAMFALPTASPALAQVRTSETVIMPEDEVLLKMHEDVGFSQAVVHGDTVYLSGFVAFMLEGDSEEDAYVRAFEAIGDILRRAGSSWDDVIELTTYHTDLPGQIAQFSEIKKRYLKPPHPAWTAVGVERLLASSGLVEMRIVARVTPTE